MNKIIVILCCFALAFSLAACASKSDAPAKTETEEIITTQEVSAKAQELNGIWYEEIAGRGQIEIGSQGGETMIYVTWSNGYAEMDSWVMSGIVDDEGFLDYSNCRMTITTYTSENSSKDEIAYEDGHGYFMLLSDGRLMWHDDMQADTQGYEPSYFKKAEFYTESVTDLVAKPSSDQSEEVDMPSMEVSEMMQTFNGIWYEEIAGRGELEIGAQGGESLAFIRWSNGASESYTWTFSGVVDENGFLLYDNCRLVITKFLDNNSTSEEVSYEDGSGYLYLLKDGRIMWQDDKSAENPDYEPNYFVKAQ